MHDDLRCAVSRGQAVWYAVQLAETLLGHEIENTASDVFRMFSLNLLYLFHPIYLIIHD